MYCPNCGRKITPVQYCVYCGKRLPAEAPEAQTSARKTEPKAPRRCAGRAALCLLPAVAAAALCAATVVCVGGERVESALKSAVAAVKKNG